MHAFKSEIADCVKKFVLVNVHFKSAFGRIMKCKLCKIILEYNILIFYSLFKLSSFISFTPRDHLATTK